MAEYRFENNRGTAPIQSELKNEELPIRKSQFDLSCKRYFPAAPFWIIPFDLIETLPDSDYDISYDLVALSTNPLVKRLMSSMDIYVHVYAQNCIDIYEGFQPFITHGRSGSYTSSIPTFQHAIPGSPYLRSHAFSPSAFLGVPFDYYFPQLKLSDNRVLSYLSKSLDSDLGDAPLYSETSWNISALPLGMYQQICVLNYMPSNLLQDNKHLYPELENHFKFSIDAADKVVYTLDYDADVASTPPTLDELRDFSYSSSDTRIFLDRLNVRQYKGDDFNTGLPFPDLIRGDIPAVELAASEVTIPSGQLITDGLGIYVNSALAAEGFVSVPAVSADTLVRTLHLSTSSNAGGFTYAGNANLSASNSPNHDNSIRLKQDLTGTVSIASSVTLNQLRALEVLTLFKERMARTDGSYNEMIKAQFNKSPDYRTGKPRYIGGFKQSMVFSEVVQSSESSEQTPLGTTASRAVTAGSGYCGHYHSDDYGYIMALLMVVPNTIYASPHVPKWATRLNQDQWYFPLQDNLAPEAILNKELYYSADAATDNDVFAYQERNYEYKSRRDEAVSWAALSHSASDDAASMIASRRFSETPTLSYSFTAGLPSSVDYGIFSNEYDPPFYFSASANIKAVQPMPYVTVPGSMKVNGGL